MSYVMMWVHVSKFGRMEVFYLATHSTHFIYGYMASDILKNQSDSKTGNLLSPLNILFTGFFIGQGSIYHGLYYTSCGILAGMKSNSMGPPLRIDLMTHYTMSERSAMDLHLAPKSGCSAITWLIHGQSELQFFNLNCFWC